MNNIEFLKSISLFKILDKEELEECSKIIERSSYDKGGKIISEGDSSTAIYIIKSGLVHISKKVDSTDKLLSVLRSGDFFGEICMFDSGLRSATATAIAKTELLKIEKNSFDNLVKEKPRLGAKVLYAMMKEMARRLRDSDEMVKNWVMWVKAVQEVSKL
jgi:CRP-like cAMP-binding protein